MSKGRHELKPLSARTMPPEYQHLKIPSGHRVAACTGTHCGGLFTGRTQDEVERQHATHVLHLAAEGAGFSVVYDEAYIHVPVLHSDSVGWCADGHRTVITERPADDVEMLSTERKTVTSFSGATVCGECSKPFVRTEDETPWRTTVIVHLWEWLGMSDDERVSWATEEGSRQLTDHLARMDEARNAPEPTADEHRAILDRQAADAEANWWAAKAEQARQDAEALTPTEG